MTRKTLLVAVLAVAVLGGVAMLGGAAERQPNREMFELAALTEQIGAMTDLLGQFRELTFEPELVVIAAVGGLKDEVPRKIQDVIGDLEAQLKTAKSIGARNAIRWTLNEIYKGQGKHDEVLRHLRAMLRENDELLFEWQEHESDEDDD